MVGENIRRYRLERGLSQAELAKQIGYKDRSTIAKIESGANDVTQTKLAAIADALGVKPADLLTISLGTDFMMQDENGEFIRVDAETKVGRLLMAFNQLNDKAQEIAIDRINEMSEVSKYQRRAPQSNPDNK